ncbi:tyrosine-type recombinase/integrase [Candidatus Woesearchaeota archaeon]|nr:tyrosine-type recombinase/integrase [Candidatus Woesearchaeota archaeon]
MKPQFKNSQFTLSEQEVEQLINASKNLRDKLIIESAYFPALRRFEIAKIRGEDIDFERGRLKVIGKNQKYSEIPVGSVFPIYLNDLKFFLQFIKRRDGYLFSNDGKKPLNVSRINQIFHETASLAKLKHPNRQNINFHTRYNISGEIGRKINPHLLRHSLARHLKSFGFNGEFIQNYLRHTNIETTFNEYGTLSLDEMESHAKQKRGLNIVNNKQLNYT